MSWKRAKARPSLEILEDRLALSGIRADLTSTAPSPKPSASTTPPILPILPAPTNPTLAALDAFSVAYGSHPGDPNYNPAYDLNHNNQVAMVDGQLLLKQLPPLSPNVPIGLKVAITPSEQAPRHHGSNSGGATYTKDITLIGKTVPGSLIFSGSGTVDWKLRGPAAVSDSQGNFAFKVNLSAGINQFDLKVVDAYGNQTMRSFPILWLGFAAYEARHPKND